MTRLNPELTRDIALSGAASTPGLAASAWTMNGLVAALTAIFLVVQIGYLVWKWNKEWTQRVTDKAALDLLMQGRVAKFGEKPPGHE